MNEEARESMDFDVVVVGAGPAGLATACRLMQISQDAGQEITVVVLEKGSEVGAHILSGAVIEPRALDELFPDWKQNNAPLNTPVTRDDIRFFTSPGTSIKMPGFLSPKTMHNHGNYVASLGNLTRWLGEQAESLGVEIFPGFAASEILYHEDGRVKGVATGDMGLDINGEPKEGHERGMEQTTGGGFLYHLEDNQVVVGLIIDLNYSNPHLSTFEEFQRFKQHPVIKDVLQGGERVSYGARAIVKGGLNSLPKMSMPGALLIGCDAGTLNFAKLKGTHMAMKSGMVAAETIAKALQSGEQGRELSEYDEAFMQSWAGEELSSSRNWGPVLHKFGMYLGGAYNYIDQNFFKGKLPFNFRDDKPDHACLLPAATAFQPKYPKPDGTISFDKPSSVFLSNTNHEDNQPVHLQLTDPDTPIKINLPKYAEPAQRYCPVGVYEVIVEEDIPRFQINSQNCIHCKTCDIKDPSQNITWVVPEGGGGPNYPNM